MPGGKTKFNVGWLSAIDCNKQTLREWCRQGSDIYSGYCKFCDSEIRCDNSGKAQLLQHAKKAKHIQSSKMSRDMSQSKFVSLVKTESSASTSNSPTPVSVVNFKDSALAAFSWLM